MKKCSICRNTNGVCNYKEYKNICRRHQNQVFKYGKILKRTIKDPNDFIIKKDYCEIVLYNIKCEEVARTIIDLDIVEKAKKYKWSLTKRGYVSSGGRKCYLHQFVLPLKDDLIVHHVNYNPLDNRRKNLRLVTYSENNKDKKEKARGICYNKREKKWVAYIDKLGKREWLGYYETELEAKVARDNKL